MKLEMTKEEQQLLLASLEVLVKTSQNALQTASQVLPLAIKVQQCSDTQE